MIGFFNLTPKRQKKLQKFLSVFTAISLIIQIGNGLFLYRPAFAQEASPTPEQTEVIVETSALPQELTIEPTVSPSEPIESSLPENTPTLEPAETPLPENTLTEEATPTPIIEITPTKTLAESPPAPNLNVNQTETPSGSNNSGDNLDLGPSGIEAPSAQLNPSLSTDKSDYNPTDTVLIRGTGFNANQTYTLIITSSHEPPVYFETQVTTDEKGEFVYAYQLDGIYRLNYKVEVKDKEGNILASTNFTDPPAGKPDKPTTTSTQTLSIDSIKFNWEDKSNDEDDFHIERKPDGGSFSEIAIVSSTTKGTTGTMYSFTDTGLNCGSKYWYRVRAHRHSDNSFSDYSSNGGNDESTLYWITNNVFDLTPDTVIQGQSNVPIFGFTMSSCKSDGKIKKVKVEYSGDNKNDISLLKLYRETGTVGGFDNTDALIASDTPPGGSSKEFNLDPTDLTVGIGQVTFYIVVDISGTATIGNRVDAKILKNKIDIDPNNPSGASDGDWPLTAEESLFDPSGSSLIASSVSWPTSWTPVIGCNTDPSDESPEQLDIVGDTVNSAVYFATDGNYLYLRERIKGNPAGPPGMFSQHHWVVLVEQTGDSYYDYQFTLNGQDEKVQIWKNNPQSAPINWNPVFGDSAETLIWEGATSAFARIDSDGTGYYFVSWAVPLSYGEFTLGANPVFYFATSADAVNHNKDHLDCYETPVTPTPTPTNTPTPTATPTPAPYCGDGIKNGQEECDGTEGVTPGQNFCTATCHLVPIYDGQHSCPAGTVKSQNPVWSETISATDSDGEIFNLTGNGKYLFEASGTFIPTSAPGYLSDAGYTLVNGLLSTQYGIHGTGNDYAAHALLADLGSGVGVVDWGQYNPEHVYTKYYEPTSSTVQFVIGDRYGDWFNTPWQNQGGMGDNSGGLILKIYECQEYGSISGYKWEDMDEDGIWDNGEPVVDGTTIPGGLTIFIDLDWDKNQEIGDPRIDVASDGSYSFVNLVPGTYNVCERADLLSGWKPTTPICQSVEVFPGQNTEVNFGNYKLGYIQGRKYNDLDEDGTRDGNESWLSGWTINLYDENWNYLSSTTTSGTNGIYRFENLDKGTYYTCEVLQAGWTQTGPTLGSNRVTNQSPNKNIEGPVCWRSVFNQSGQSRTGRQFGNSQLGSVSGYKYEDVNGNGQRDESENNLLSGWTIQLRNSEGDLVGEVVTGEDGFFELNNFVAGNYKLCEVVQSGWVVTDPQNNNCKDITIEAGKTTEVNFGNFKLGRIEACKYDDLDGDGVKDVGEPGIAGVNVKLQEQVAGETVSWGDVGDWEETGNNGCYVWEELGPGNYRVLEDLNDTDLAGYVPTDDFLTEDTYRVADGLVMTSGGVVTVNFLNKLLPVTLGISKTNNTTGSVGPGTAVNYTLIVTNNSAHTAYGVTVLDVLPYGFSYVSGSGKVGGASVDPTISGQVLTWTVGNLAGGTSVEITYQVSTDGGLETGSFTNMTYAYGYNRKVDDPNKIRSESNIASSVVKIGVGTTYSATVSPIVGGTVLGAATTSGQVLGAATGSPTYWLVLALLMIIAGITVRNWEKMKKFKFGKIIKVLILAVGILLTVSQTTQAAVQVTISDLPERINKYDFKVYYTVLDTSEAPSYSVSGWMHKEGASWKQFDVTKTEPSGYFQTKGEYFDGEGKYYFKVVSNGVESSVEEVVIDFSSPDGPRDYRKERLSSTEYKLYWKNPSNSDFEKVLVYRSEVRDFTADSSTLVGQRGGSPDQEMDFVDCCLTPNKEYFYALRAIDKAGNASGLVGDGGSIIYMEVTPTPGAVEGAVEVVKVLPKEEGKEGEILGEEAEETKAGELGEMAKEEGGVLGTVGETVRRNKNWILLLGILIIGTGAFIIYRRRSSVE